jgi:16S rRNA (guanine527-N7)-methyltransferase
MDDRFAVYAALVRSYGRKLDLVAPGDLDRFEARHIEDSLRALDVVRSAPEGPCADLGSGAGLPGIPLAIADPSRRWRLIEPRRRRAAFLEEVVRTLGIDAEVVVATAAEAAGDAEFAHAHAVAAARALAPPDVALGMLAPLVAPGGMSLVFLGAETEVPPGSVEVQPGLAIVRNVP